MCSGVDAGGQGGWDGTMLVVLSAFALLVGFALWVASLMDMSRANAGDRLPYFSRPLLTPRRAIIRRAVGGGLIVLSTAVLSLQVGHGLFAILAYVALIGLTAAGTAVHNRRVGAAGGSCRGERPARNSC
jgi:hypothetical protein